MTIILILAIFFSILLFFELGYAVLGRDKTRSTRQVFEKYLSRDGEDAKHPDLLYARKMSEIPALNKILVRLPFCHRLETLIAKSGVNMLVGFFLLLSFSSGAVAALAAYLYIGGKIIVILPVSVIAALVPWFYILFMKKKRLQKFIALFPDTLALMTRSMKAGHALISSFKMVADEMPSPIGDEFTRIVEEINFGRGLDGVLTRFAARMDHPDINYFAVAVIIQRQTGGNLGEIMENVADNIRKKFRFKEKIRTITAEGKLSAMVLVCVPFLVAFFIYISNKDYLKVLGTDALGPYIIGGALLLMGLGIFVMNRIVNIEV